LSLTIRFLLIYFGASHFYDSHNLCVLALLPVLLGKHPFCLSFTGTLANIDHHYLVYTLLLGGLLAENPRPVELPVYSPLVWVIDFALMSGEAAG
jgi:hypothetical protein